MNLDDFGGLLDWSRLQPWMEAQSSVPGTGPVRSVRRLTGGSQNNLFLLEREGGRSVLRRPPARLRAESNKTMMREVRLLEALRDTAVPHARLFAACEDQSIIGANFYVMDVLEGWSMFGPLQGRYATDANWRRAVGEEVVRAAAALAAVNCKARGLEDFGKAEDWHARQVPRWMGQLESYAATPGYDGSAFRVDDIGKWLDTNIVSDRRIGLIHGDFQFPNMMFSLEAPVISGLIDWELSTLGDPLLDFAWTLSSWWDDGDPVGSAPPCTPWDGFMTRGELVSLYGELSGRDMGGMPWFLVLACYKLGIILEGSYVRSKTGAMPIATGEMLHGYALRLLNKARQVMASGTI